MPERDIRVLSAKEIGELLSACPSLRWRSLVALAVTTGMRLGEMQALTWDDVDLESGSAMSRGALRSPVGIGCWHSCPRCVIC